KSIHSTIRLPGYIHHLYSLQSFCDQVFPPTIVNLAHTNFNTFNNRAVLSFHNDTVAEFNQLLIGKLHGTLYTLNAMNSVAADDSFPGVEHIPAEFLQSLECSSLPPSRLTLKIGAPIILLQNLNPKQGLCNGTRMVVTQLG